MKSLVDKFLSLRCASDVLESVGPMPAATREISEAMILIDAIKGFVLKEKTQRRVLHFCPTYPLAGVLAAHLLPVESTSAIAWRPKRLLGLDRVQNFRINSMPLSVATWAASADLADNTLVIANSVNYDLAMDIARFCSARDLPLAMLPSRVKRRKLGSGLLAGADPYLAHLTVLSLLTGGDIAVCVADTPSNGLIVRGLQTGEKKNEVQNS